MTEDEWFDFVQAVESVYCEAWDRFVAAVAGRAEATPEVVAALHEFHTQHVQQRMAESEATR